MQCWAVRPIFMSLPPPTVEANRGRTCLIATLLFPRRGPCIVMAAPDLVIGPSDARSRLRAVLLLPSHFAQSFPCPRRPCTPEPYKYIYINTRIYIYIYKNLQRMFFCYSCVTNVVHKCKYFSTLEECAEMSYCLSEPRVVESWFFGEKK